MKQLFSKQYFILAIALCIITSCKLTGNFAIVKRQHEKGYYIEMPSIVKNNGSITAQAKKQAKQLKTEQSATVDDNFIASVDAMSLVQIEQEAKAITNDNYMRLYTINAIARDSSKKKPPAPPNKNVQGKATNPVNNKTQANTTNNKPPEPKKDDRKLDWVSVTGFALCLFALALTPVDIAMIATASGVAAIVGVLAGLCLLTGIAFSFTGFNRISDVAKKLKGKGFALTGVILGTLLFVAAFVGFIIFAYRVFMAA